MRWLAFGTVAAAAVWRLIVAGQDASGTARHYWPLLRRVRRVRRWLLTRQLRRLDVGLTLAAMERILGPHDRLIRDAQGRAFIFERPEVTITAHVDDDEAVTGYEVALTSRGYRPRLALADYGHPSIVVTLGSTCFAELPEPNAVDGFVGNRYGYRELHYLGNPGRYLWYVVGHEPTGGADTPNELWKALQSEQWQPTPADAIFTCRPEALDSLQLRCAREVTPITTYMILRDPAGWSF